MGVISRILDSVDRIAIATADTTTTAAESKVALIVKLAALLLGAILLLILFAIDGTLALGLVALIIVALYLLDVDLGGGDSSSGPRE